MTSGSRVSLFFGSSDAIRSASAKGWFMRLGAVMASFTPPKPAGCASRQRPVAHGRIATGWVRGRRSLDSAASLRTSPPGTADSINGLPARHRPTPRHRRPNQGPARRMFGVELIDPSAA
jgi:hypothetical protein